MGKLTLEIDSLKVESFETRDEHRGQAAHGTFYETCGCTVADCDTREPVC
jgi:hypothetical protein